MAGLSLSWAVAAVLLASGSSKKLLSPASLATGLADGGRLVRGIMLGRVVAASSISEPEELMSSPWNARRHTRVEVDLNGFAVPLL